MLDHRIVCRSIKILFFIFFSCSNILFAAERNISVELSDGTYLSGVHIFEKIEPRSSLSLLGVTVGYSKLDDVKRKFHVNNIYHDGDAAKSMYSLCFKGNDGTILTFESNSEMGGKDHIVTSATILSRNESYRFIKQCSVSELINHSIQFSDGLHLGMSKADLKKAKGRPSKETAKIAFYQYQLTKKTSKGAVDVLSGIEIKFVRNQATKISISKIESY